MHHDLDEQWSVNLTIGWENWSQLGEVPLDQQPRRRIPTKWRDTYHYAWGAEYRLDKRWAFTSGVAYDTNPVDKRKTATRNYLWTARSPTRSARAILSATPSTLAAISITSTWANPGLRRRTLVDNTRTTDCWCSQPTSAVPSRRRRGESTTDGQGRGLALPEQGWRHNPACPPALPAAGAGDRALRLCDHPAAFE